MILQSHLDGLRDFPTQTINQKIFKDNYVVVNGITVSISLINFQ